MPALLQAPTQAQPVVVQDNPCDHMRLPAYSKQFQNRLADEMRQLPTEAQRVIVDAGKLREDVRACKATH